MKQRRKRRKTENEEKDAEEEKDGEQERAQEDAESMQDEDAGDLTTEREQDEEKDVGQEQEHTQEDADGVSMQDEDDGEDDSDLATERGVPAVIHRIEPPTTLHFRRSAMAQRIVRPVPRAAILPAPEVQQGGLAGITAKTIFSAVDEPHRVTATLQGVVEAQRSTVTEQATPRQQRRSPAADQPEAAVTVLLPARTRRPLPMPVSPPRRSATSSASTDSAAFHM
jgi:hypothetical protein